MPCFSPPAHRRVRPAASPAPQEMLSLAWRRESIFNCIPRVAVQQCQSRRLQPKTAFSRLPPVHEAELEGRLRVQKLWGPRQGLAPLSLYASR